MSAGGRYDRATLATGSSASRRRIGAYTSHSASTSSVPSRRRATPPRPPARRPVHLAAGVHRVQRTGQRHAVASGASGIDVAQQVRVRIAEHEDARAAPLDAFLDVAIPPDGRVAERVRVGVLQARALDVLIPVQDAHVVGADLVGHVGDRPGQGGVLDVLGEDDDVLPGRDVRAEFDGEPRELARPLRASRRRTAVTGRSGRVGVARHAVPMAGRALPRTSTRPRAGDRAAGAPRPPRRPAWPGRGGSARPRCRARADGSGCPRSHTRPRWAEASIRSTRCSSASITSSRLSGGGEAPGRHQIGRFERGYVPQRVPQQPHELGFAVAGEPVGGPGRAPALASRFRPPRRTRRAPASAGRCRSIPGSGWPTRRPPSSAAHAGRGSRARAARSARPRAAADGWPTSPEGYLTKMTIHV